MSVFIFLTFGLLGPQAAEANDTEKGRVIKAVNDEKFVIETRWGTQIFEASTFCFGIRDGEEVIFTESTAVCVSNTFIGLKSGKKCEVWCP